MLLGFAAGHSCVPEEVEAYASRIGNATLIDPSMPKAEREGPLEQLPYYRVSPSSLTRDIVRYAHTQWDSESINESRGSFALAVRAWPVEP